MSSSESPAEPDVQPPAVQPPVATGYAAAQRELEEILAELERSDVDVDRLATQVQRAAALIGFCHDRILHARVQIDQVVGDLGDDRG